MSKEYQVVDPQNEAGLEFHAARALGRRRQDDPTIAEFESIADPKARREAIMNANFRNTGVHPGEAKKMRRRVLRIVDNPEGKPKPLTPEQNKLLGTLEAQADDAISVWIEEYPKFWNLKTAKERMADAAKDWLFTLPDQTLDGLIKLCPETAQLVAIPPIAVPEQMELINLYKKIEGQRDGKIPNPEWNSIQVQKWRFGITDFREDMPFDPTIFYMNPEAPENERVKRTNEKMVEEYSRRFTSNGLGLMPPHGYVPTVANALVQGRFLDRTSATVFERPDGAIWLPMGHYSSRPSAYSPSDGDHILLGRNPRNAFPDKELRCRPWVEGEMTDEALISLL